MYIEQIYTKCLSEATYYIESNGFAAVIDPLREVQPYIDLAKRRGAEIIYVFETHFHADFVSGHVDLSNKTEAVIVFGPTTMQTGFPCLVADDGQVFQLGDISIQLIHTPGHTMESSCFLLKDESGKPTALFTGDTLFIGDVGRPDLAQKIIGELTPQKLAGHLYDSLKDKILPLPDDLIVYPGHGAGSACGKNMSKETTDTLGHQKRVNYALNTSLSKEEFTSQVLSGLAPPPAYFPQDVLLNIKGYESIDKILSQSTRPLSLPTFVGVAGSNQAVILDTRNALTFAAGFVPGSINIGLEGNFASWVGTLIKDTKTPILFIAEPGKENEVVTRMARIGFDHVLGYLKGGFATWLQAGQAIDHIESISAEEFAALLKIGTREIIDARTSAEFESGHLEGAKNLPLDYIDDYKASITTDKVSYVHCAAGYRSMAFISLLRRQGYVNLVNVAGGFNAIKNSRHFDRLKIVPAPELAGNFCDITKRKQSEKF
jgi:hydroxyacylglutathione hydrolase